MAGTPPTLRVRERLPRKLETGGVVEECRLVGVRVQRSDHRDIRRCNRRRGVNHHVRQALPDGFSDERNHLGFVQIGGHLHGQMKQLPLRQLVEPRAVIQCDTGITASQCQSHRRAVSLHIDVRNQRIHSIELHRGAVLRRVLHDVGGEVVVSTHACGGQCHSKEGVVGPSKAANNGKGNVWSVMTMAAQAAAAANVHSAYMASPPISSVGGG